MKLSSSLIFLEAYFIGVICYVSLTCLLFDPTNLVAFLIIASSAASAVSIYSKRRLGFHLSLLSSALIFITFLTAFRFSIKFRSGIAGNIYDASLVFFSILSILAFIVVLDKYR
ncbi:MAG: hypothetical protein QXE79_05730 [Candidatus Bathyarchaeia archaeon]